MGVCVCVFVYVHINIFGVYSFDIFFCLVLFTIHKIVGIVYTIGEKYIDQ